jgi:predicted nucleotidyltransferase
MRRDDALAIIARHRPLFRAAYLFGSTARDEADEQSDTDIVLVRETDKDFFHRIVEVMPLVDDLGAVDALIYTPAEFGRLREARGFLETVIQEAIKVEGEQS